MGTKIVIKPIGCQYCGERLDVFGWRVASTDPHCRRIECVRAYIYPAKKKKKK